ncbi:hypothetical protein EI53_00431 [Fusobacterium naviforme]|nr:hypothetical protein F7P78_02165 [Fusobacterium naviforme]PSL11400.1 hypothetical protein EI53_00431 [Fusobacterium naviforme]STO26482.1 Uncharacterised protein [Fusobacterium naviforme]
MKKRSRYYGKLVLAISAAIAVSATACASATLPRGREQASEHSAENETAAMITSQGSSPAELSAALENEASSSAEADISPAEHALQEYASVIEHAADYAYDDSLADWATGAYYYAVLNISSEQPDIPQLILQQEGTGVLVAFDFDPQTGHAVQISGELPQGTMVNGAAVLGGLMVKTDGSGLSSVSFSRGTGETIHYFYSISNHAVSKSIEWEGNFGDTPAVSEAADIIWHSTSDKSGLEQYTPGEKTVQENTEDSSAHPEEEIQQKIRDAENSGLVVLRGRLREMTYAQVLELQNKRDPNPGYSDPDEKMLIFELTEPREIAFRTYDDRLSPHTVRIIRIWGSQELSAYYDREVVMSFDPSDTYWPSDTSVPLGQPSGDGHLLGEVK